MNDCPQLTMIEVKHDRPFGQFPIGPIGLVVERRRQWQRWRWQWWRPNDSGTVEGWRNYTASADATQKKEKERKKKKKKRKDR